MIYTNAISYPHRTLAHSHAHARIARQASHAGKHTSITERRDAVPRPARCAAARPSLRTHARLPTPRTLACPEAGDGGPSSVSAPTAGLLTRAPRVSWPPPARGAEPR